jgi:hypothetical protein
MVAMFMGDNDAVKLLGSQAQPRQTCDCFRQSEAAIQQYASLTKLHYQRVSFASAAE